MLMLETDGAAGFSRGRKLEKIGMPAQDTSELSFDDVFIPDEDLLGTEGDGFAQLMHQLAWERIVIALDATVNIERRSEEHTSELQSLMRITYAVFCFQKKKQ